MLQSKMNVTNLYEYTYMNYLMHQYIEIYKYIQS